MRIGIYGCGAMGTVLGAYLSRAGLNIELIDIYEEHVNKLNSD
jgi:2-dehydropantoate 2-reductase